MSEYNSEMSDCNSVVARCSSCNLIIVVKEKQKKKRLTETEAEADKGRKNKRNNKIKKI